MCRGSSGREMMQTCWMLAVKLANTDCLVITPFFATKDVEFSLIFAALKQPKRTCWLHFSLFPKGQMNSLYFQTEEGYRRVQVHIHREGADWLMMEWMTTTSGAFLLLWSLDEDEDDEDDNDSPPPIMSFFYEGGCRKRTCWECDRPTSPLSKQTTEKLVWPTAARRNYDRAEKATRTHPRTLNTQTYLISPLDRGNTNTHTHTVEKHLLSRPHSHALCGNSYSPSAALIRFPSVPLTSQ